MSEHYDFHYQPTGSGAISGQQVLQQTEDAINELGDYVNDNVGGAMDVAQQALETAQTAETNAQTALDTANSFSSAIQSAQQDASTALSTAQTAQTTASNANNTAIQAQQDASSAVTTANNASGQVSTLSGTVTALGQRVTTAEGNIGQNTSDITALTNRVGTAEGNITTLQNDVSIAQGNASSAMATAGTVKQQAYVFRYSSTALVASSTNSNTLLDNTDNLKVGDKVIDSSGVLFSITAIDTANSTFTIGTALVDLAQDSDVVHKTGDETVGGKKTFRDDLTIYNYDSSQNTKNLNISSSKIQIGDTSNSDAFGIRFNAGASYVAQILAVNDTTGTQNLQLGIRTKDGSDNLITSMVRLRLSANGNSSFEPGAYDSISLGSSSFKWKSVYATNYYYGSNNVEFSTKFVTTDTAQTISGTKTFTDNNTIKTSSPKVLLINTSQTGNTAPSENTASFFRFDGGTVNNFGGVQCEFLTTGENRLSNYVKDITTAKINSIQQRANSTTAMTIFNADLLVPVTDGVTALGSYSKRWSDCQTNLINGITPSSLSMPSDNIANIIDISGYLTVLDGSQANTYQAPDNGYIGITMSNCTSIQAYITGFWGNQIVRPTAGALRFFMPICKNMIVNILVFGGTVDNARFFPCQGNV